MSAKHPTLEHWSIWPGGEAARLSPGEGELPVKLVGEVYDHPRHADGKRVLTSAVISCDCDRVLTLSGTVYLLGAIDPAYNLWLKNGPEDLSRLPPCEAMRILLAGDEDGDDEDGGDDDEIAEGAIEDA